MTAGRKTVLDDAQKAELRKFWSTETYQELGKRIGVSEHVAREHGLALGLPAHTRILVAKPAVIKRGAYWASLPAGRGLVPLDSEIAKGATLPDWFRPEIPSGAG